MEIDICFIEDVGKSQNCSCFFLTLLEEAAVFRFFLLWLLVVYGKSGQSHMVVPMDEAGTKSAGAPGASSRSKSLGGKKNLGNQLGVEPKIGVVVFYPPK